MRIVHRIVMLAVLGAFGFVLAGCTDFDPDKLDVFHLNEKKKLPGERKELFPNGVPGVTQGIPPEYMKGYQEPSDPAAQTPLPGQSNPAAEAEPAKKTAAAEPAEEPKPKPKPKRKPKAQSPSQQPVVQQSSGQQQPPAWPQQSQQQQPQQAQSPWPAPQGQATTTAPWPSAPPPGTFSR